MSCLRLPVQGYRLRIVGHSIGAATAVILALMLRNEFEDLRYDDDDEEEE
jgi:pimeloyl-ACP methyl ester carboxylesterase